MALLIIYPGQLQDLYYRSSRGDIGETDDDMDYSDGDEADNDDNNLDNDSCSSTCDLFDKTSLSMSQVPTGSTSKSLPTSPYSDPREAFEHIQKELGLFDVGAVKSLLEHMITYLEEVLLPRQDAANSLSLPTSKNPILERSRLSLKDMDLLSIYVDLGRPNTPSAYFNFDKDGDDLWVCLRHHLCLDPGFRMNHVKRIIRRFGSYHAATGKIDVHLRTPKHLAVLCRIDPIKASRITDLKVALGWSPSSAELTELASLARSLDLKILSMTGKCSGAGSSSALSRSLAATQADTALVRDIIRSCNQLATVTINWDSDLDAATLVQEASLEGHSLQFLTIKTGRQEVLTVMFKSHLGIKHVISELGDLPLESRGSFLARKVQNLTIGPCILSTNKDQAIVWKADLFSAIQENCSLTSLTINCKAQDFSSIFDALQSMLCKLDNPLTYRHSIRFITLMDPQADTAAQFSLAPLNHQSPAVVDVTVGTIGSAHFSVIQNYGSFIRVLNLFDDAAESSGLFKFFTRSKPTHLVSLMLNVTKLSCQSGMDLRTVTTLSKNTFKQLTLIGLPKNPEAISSLLDAIQCLRGCQILLTRTGPASMETWIKRVRGVAHESSRVFDFETPDEVRLMVHELSPFGFALLKSTFDRSKSIVMKRRRRRRGILDERFDSDRSKRIVMRRKKRTHIILDKGVDSLFMADTVVDHYKGGQFSFY
ncbi:hypothetical protein BGZ95_009341 [Linnemannia exigua]|uniref:Uncharacterized protein n=1 Tax=Linnemannia exigua TaxID=604196 RepID=A0AAD4H7Y3_9FUNG|nr:hypothetical protein BGZ95_009341 [Linnemannia exigua]